MIASAPTEREGRIGARIGALRFVPVVLAVGVFAWIALRMVLPYRLEVVVVDQVGRPVAGAGVTAEAGATRERETDDDGRCAFWVRRGDVTYQSALLVHVPDLGIRHAENWSWRQLRRGGGARITLDIGDTAVGAVYDSVTRQRLSGVRARATFVYADGAEQLQTNVPGNASPYGGGGYWRNGAWSMPGDGGDGTFSVTRSGSRDSATSVRLVVWAPGHAPRTLALEPASTSRGCALFDAGDVLLTPWAQATGRITTRQKSRGEVSHTGLVVAVVWSEVVEELRNVEGDPSLQAIGSDGDTTYAILRSGQNWSPTFDVTLPVPAARVVLVAIAYDRPPAVVEVNANLLAKLEPGDKLAGYDTLELPSPNPLTLTFKTPQGGAVTGARVTFALVLPGSDVAVAISQSPVVTDQRGRLTVPTLADGATYRINVRKQTGETIEFDSVIEPRAEIVVPGE